MESTLTPDQVMDQQKRKESYIAGLLELEKAWEFTFAPRIGAEGPHTILLDKKIYDAAKTN